jgi:hypothetical protein
MEVVGRAWICILYALICCVDSHTLEWPIGVVFIGSNPPYSRWKESNSFLSTGTPDSPVPQPESAHCGPLCVDCPVVPPDSPVHIGQLLFNVRCTIRRWLTALLKGN